MKKIYLSLLAVCMMISCNNKPDTQAGTTKPPIEGTWHLLNATNITGKDSTVTDYTRDQEMIKVINATHFAFFRHDLSHGKDTAHAMYGSGGGRYALKGDKYTEYLDYCDDRQWEGHQFDFTVTISGDTLLQKGIEKLENLGIDRFIIEKYVRVKNP